MKLISCCAIALSSSLAIGVAGASAAPPANDAFVDASPVPSAAASSTLNADTTEATREIGEQGPASEAGPTVWFRWTAAESRPVTISTCGQTSLDTVIYVFRGTTLGSLSPVANNDDATGGVCGLQSKLSFTSQKGIAYSIQLSTFGSAVPGPFPAILETHAATNNDDFAQATAIPGPDALYSFDTAPATKQSGEPNHAGNVGGKSIWYSWQAPANGTTTIDTCGSSFDTLLAVYTGAVVSALTPVASNDDFCGQQSSVSFAATSGVTYRIAVDGYASVAPPGAFGTGQLSLQLSTMASSPPQLLIDGPEGPTSSTDASFYFGADRYTTSFTCSLDTATPAPCWPDQQFTSLADGEHTFHVSAGGTNATRTFTVDTIAPTIQIDNPSADGATVTDSTPTLAFTAGSDAATIECSVDTGSASFGPCSGPGGSHTPPPLADGLHTFRVRVADAAANQRTATRTFTVDTSTPVDSTPADDGDRAAPQTSIDRLKLKRSRRKATVTFSATDDGTLARFECRLDQGPFKACKSPKTYKKLRPGKHTVSVRAVDAAGNTDPTPAKKKFKLAKR